MKENRGRPGRASYKGARACRGAKHVLRCRACMPCGSLPDLTPMGENKASDGLDEAQQAKPKPSTCTPCFPQPLWLLSVLEPIVLQPGHGSSWLDCHRGCVPQAASPLASTNTSIVTESVSQDVLELRRVTHPSIRAHSFPLVAAISHPAVSLVGPTNSSGHPQLWYPSTIR